MQLSWSVSRDQILHNCERCYYFQYLATAKINSRDKMLQEIAFLKKVKNIPLWKGDAFHTSVAGYLRNLRAGVQPTLAQLTDRIREQMMSEWNFSSNKEFIVNPRGVGKAGGLALFEHVYEVEVEREVSDIIEEVITGLSQFAAWIKDSDVLDSLIAASRIWLEEPVYGPNAPCFYVDRVQVLVKTDLAILTPDNKFEIFDWKTGAPSSFPSKVPNGAEFQVNVYQLWPHLGLGHPLESIQAHLLYIEQESPLLQTFGIDGNLKEQTLASIRRSIDRVKMFAGLHENGQEKLRLCDCDFGFSVNRCKRCKFKRLCQRMVENELV